MRFRGDVRGLRGYGIATGAARFSPEMLAKAGILGTRLATVAQPIEEQPLVLPGAKVVAYVAPPAMGLEEKARALEALGFKLRTTPASAPAEPSVNLAMQALGFRGNYDPATLEAMLRAGDSRLPALARDVAQWQLSSLDAGEAYPEWLGSLAPPPPPQAPQFTLEQMWAPLETIGFNLRGGASYRKPDEATVRQIISIINDELRVDPDSMFNWPKTMAMIARLDPQVYEAVAVFRKQMERDIASQQVGAQKSIDAQAAKIADIDQKIQIAQGTMNAILLTGNPSLADPYRKQLNDLQSQRNGLLQFMPTIPQMPTWVGDAGLRSPPPPVAAANQNVAPVAPAVVTDTGTVVPATALPGGATSPLMASPGGFLKTYWPLLAVGGGALALLTVVAARKE